MAKRKALVWILSIHTLPAILTCVVLFMSCLSAAAQTKTPYVRIATITVDSMQLTNYKAAIEEHAKAAVSKEPGVLTLYAVYDKEQPNRITVFEIYASVSAYQSHIKTSHFLKYKAIVKDMVKSLVLTDVVPIALEAKQKISN